MGTLAGLAVLAAMAGIGLKWVMEGLKQFPK